tara:strand:+ start:95 stop:238 length:144 start_codon:yes stop_codon:yes gene_type:complete
MTNDKKEYYVINRFNGAVQVVISRNRYEAMQKGRDIFGNVALDLYAR